ncbi:MAG: YgiT-type zinc finger protein [Chloroflexi bacterium]|nr:YgiT-type zinc finger protein [Chloroflexota bacterium]
MSNHLPETNTCPSCQVGLLRPTRQVYVHLYNGTLVHAPNVPAWRCDVCGASFYDSKTLNRIELLIGDAGPPPNHHLPTPEAPDDRPAHAEEPPEQPDTSQPHPDPL